MSFREREKLETLTFGLVGLKPPFQRSYHQLPSPEKPNKILVSVCVSTYNRHHNVIIHSVESILKQKLPPENYEIIIVDDASEFPLEAKSAANYLVDSYPENNIRMYFTKFTRCYMDTHTLNVAYKRSLGDIVMTSQSDLLHLGETLESAWRQHNWRNDLYLCPMAIGKDGKEFDVAHLKDIHEYGSSVRSEWVRRIHGRNENMIVDVPDVEFLYNMAKMNELVVTKDKDAHVLHAFDKIDDKRRNRPAVSWPAWDKGGLDMRNKDGTWTNSVRLGESWGRLTPEEEKNVVMTKSMKKVLDDN